MLAKSTFIQRHILSSSHYHIRHTHIATAAGHVYKSAACSGYMAPKRKADQGEAPEKKPRAKSAKKDKPPSEPHTDDDGWTVTPPSLLFK